MQGPTQLICVAEWLYNKYWDEWRAINKRWPAFDENLVVRELRFTARRDLREWVRHNAIASGGRYIIAV